MNFVLYVNSTYGTAMDYRYGYETHYPQWLSTYMRKKNFTTYKTLCKFKKKKCSLFSKLTIINYNKLIFFFFSLKLVSKTHTYSHILLIIIFFYFTKFQLNSK